jgi:hypothetical protein
MSAYGISYQYSTKISLVFGVTSLNNFLVILQNDGELWIVNYKKSKIMHHSIVDLIHFNLKWDIVGIDNTDDFLIRATEVNFSLTRDVINMPCICAFRESSSRWNTTAAYLNSNSKYLSF